MSVHATVTVTIEIDVPSHWADDVHLDQVHRQATVDALGLIDGAQGNLIGGRRWRIIGKPVVDAVIVRGKP